MLLELNEEEMILLIQAVNQHVVTLQQQPNRRAA